MKYLAFFVGLLIFPAIFFFASPAQEAVGGAPVFFPSGSGPQYVLSVTDGCAEWSSNVLTSAGAPCSTGGGGAWATSTDLIYTQDYVLVGAVATSTSALLEVRGLLTADRFTATSTSASSTLPFLTTTDLAVGSEIFISGDAISDFAGTGLTVSSGALTADLGTTITSSEIVDDEIVNADINSAAAIAYSKLSLSNSIVNADISSSAAVAYSKLNLAGSIVETDISINAPTDNYLLMASSSATGGWEWVATSSALLNLATGGGGGTSHATTTYTVCELSTCDYVTDGTADEVQINQALSRASSTGGVVQLFADTYNIAAPIELAGLTADADGNPHVELVGVGQQATIIDAPANTNGINITNQPKFTIGKMMVKIEGSGDCINQTADTERGNWQSRIYDFFCEGDFSTMTSDSWGIYMESPFRMMFENIEMNGVYNGIWLTAHTESFNPGNLTGERIFIDLWSSATNGVGMQLTTTATTSTGVFNLTTWDTVHIAGGASLTGSKGIYLRGATADPGGSYYGEVRQNNFNNLNIEDVQQAIVLEAAPENQFTNINYTRVLNGGDFFVTDDESSGNLFQNAYIASKGSTDTNNIIFDSSNNNDEPNTFEYITGFNASGNTHNATVTAATIIRHINLTGGSPTVDSDLDPTNHFEGALEFLTTAGTKILDWAGSVVTLLGAWDFGGADSLEIPNGANPTTDTLGEIAFDTTDDQLIVDDGTTDYVFRGEDVIFKVTIASTSPEFVSGGVIPIPPEKDGFALTKFRCYVDGGTSIVVNLSDGTNDTETITCATTLTSDDDVATNDTFTAGELAEIQIGTITGSPNYLSFTAYGTWTRE